MQQHSPSRNEEKASKDEERPTQLRTPPLEQKLIFSHDSRIRTGDPIYQPSQLYHSRSSEDIHHLPCPLFPTFPSHPNNMLHLQYLQQQLQEYYQQQSRLRMYYHPEPLAIKPKV